VRLSRWKSKLPVRGCESCYEGTVITKDYIDTECKKCKGTGVVRKSLCNRTSDINKQITENLKDNEHSSRHS